MPSHTSRRSDSGAGSNPVRIAGAAFHPGRQLGRTSRPRRYHNPVHTCQRLELSSDSLTKPYHAFETLEMVYGAQGPYKRALHGFTAGRTWSSRSTRLDTGIQNHCSMPESQKASGAHKPPVRTCRTDMARQNRAPASLYQCSQTESRSRDQPRCI